MVSVAGGDTPCRLPIVPAPPAAVQSDVRRLRACGGWDRAWAGATGTNAPLSCGQWHIRPSYTGYWNKTSAPPRVSGAFVPVAVWRTHDDIREFFDNVLREVEPEVRRCPSASSCQSIGISWRAFARPIAIWPYAACRKRAPCAPPHTALHALRQRTFSNTGSCSMLENVRLGAAGRAVVVRTVVGRGHHRYR